MTELSGMFSSQGTEPNPVSGGPSAMPVEQQMQAIITDELIRQERLEALRKFRETQDAKNLVKFVHDAYTKCKSARTLQEQQWLMNLAMYKGKQTTEAWIGTNPAYAGRLYTPPARGRGRSRSKTVNRIKPAIRTELARLLSQKPSASVIPASAEDEDMFAAIAGQQVWESISNRRKMHYHFSKAAFWTVITGTGFLKTYWDDSAVDRDSHQPGDIIYEAIPPFNLFVPDLRAEDIEDQPYVLHMYTKTRAWLKHFYKDELEDQEIKPSTVQANDLLAESYIGISGAEKANPDSCMVYEMWIKPGGYEAMPQGGLVTLVDNVIVAYEPTGLPYEHQEYPFAKYDHIPSGMFYADSVIVDLTPLQKEYNKIRGQISEAADKMGKMQLIAPKGSIMPAKIVNEHGLVIEYRPGMAPPQPLPLQELPSHIVNQQSQILMDMEDVSGQHQVSRGNVPPGVTAATAISVLQEKDDSLLVHTYQSIEQSAEKIARQTLALVVQYWDIPRTVKVVGEDNFFDVLMLSGADLRNGTDIRMEPGSSLPQSKAGKQAFILDLMNAGHIPSEEGLKKLEMGGANQIVEQLRFDERQAQRENIKLKNVEDTHVRQKQSEIQMLEMQGITADETGQPLLPLIVQVNPFDNHEVHIEIHNRYRKSQAYELLSPAAKSQFEMHVQMHEQMMIQEQLEMMLNMIPTDGTLPSSGNGMVDLAAQQSFDSSGQDVLAEDTLTDTPTAINEEGVL